MLALSRKAASEVSIPIKAAFVKTRLDYFKLPLSPAVFRLLSHLSAPPNHKTNAKVQLIGEKKGMKPLIFVSANETFAGIKVRRPITTPPQPAPTEAPASDTASAISGLR